MIVDGVPVESWAHAEELFENRFTLALLLEKYNMDAQMGLAQFALGATHVSVSSAILEVNLQG